MKQSELFEVRQIGNVTLFETEPKLASDHSVDNTMQHPCINGQENIPAPASSLPPFARNSETSRQAAIEKYNLNDAENQRYTIYRWIKFKKAYGATRFELSRDLEIDGDTLRPRVWELLGKDGHPAQIKVLEGKTRKTKKGKDAEILVAI